MAVYDLSPLQVGHGEEIMGVARGRGLIDKASEYAIACSGAEASMTNWANAGTSTHVAKGGVIDGRQLNDAERAETARSLGSPYSDGTPPWGDNLDSCGLFAQRWIEGWCGGDVMAIMTPPTSTDDFLNHLVAVPNWETLPPGEVIKKVQGYYSDIYTDWLDTAVAFVAARPAGAAPTPEPELPAVLTVVRAEGVDYGYDADAMSLFLRIPTEKYYRDLLDTGVLTVPHGQARSVERNIVDWLRGQVAGSGGRVHEPAE